MTTNTLTLANVGERLTTLSTALYERWVDPYGSHRATLGDLALAFAECAQLVTDDAPNAQANALLERVQRNQGPSVVFRAPAGGLPDGYLLVVEHVSLDGFECGIAPDGRVSS